jgi:hypothetical protein
MNREQQLEAALQSHIEWVEALFGDTPLSRDPVHMEAKRALDGSPETEVEGFVSE